jgi:hypothetical protein
MSAAGEIIARSLRLLGVLSETETPSASLAIDALAMWNSMIDSWSIEGLPCYVNLRQNFPLQQNINSYTIGPTGTWTGTRPFGIIGVPFIRDFNGYDYPMQILDLHEWDRLGTKTPGSQVNADIPNVFYYEATYPNGTVYIWPTPLFAYNVYFDCLSPLTSIAALNTTLSFPQGYERAFTYNLAIELSGFFPERPIPPAVARNAQEAKANIKAVNMPSMNLGFELGVKARKPTYNIYRDSP